MGRYKCVWYRLFLPVAFGCIAALHCGARVVNTCLVDEIGEDKVISPWNGNYDSVRLEELVYV